MTTVPVEYPYGSMREGDLAILFLTHKWSRPAAKRFVRLWREMSPRADCFLLLQDDGGEVRQRWTDLLRQIGASGAMVLFQADKIESALGYRRNSQRGLVPGSVHFPLLSVARHIRYCHYWLVEYDVDYRGRWPGFFDLFSSCNADLLAAHVKTYDDDPDWFWWPHFFPPSGVELGQAHWHKVFMPIYRASAAALACTDAAHLAGWRGHVEALMPTVLRLSSLDVQDMNAVAPCYAGSQQDSCADTQVQSTLRYRPAVSYYEFVNRGQSPLLFHPIKDW